MNKNLLIVFIRNPVHGLVKTRLAEETGSKVALAIYNELLSAVFRNAIPVKSDKALYFSDEIDETIDPGVFFEPQIQKGIGLGERMSNAFMESFSKGYERTVLIGSDCFELTPEVINKAFESLRNSDCVIGPATDGGYYLIGLRRAIPELFLGITWGSSEVLNQTIHIMDHRAISYSMIDALNDVDRLEDVMKYSKLKRFLYDKHNNTNP
ncbi:MAG: TIGR04282 family arsenosugar biosynthesis glycosyltransferase [Bacteroidales bacterium]|nr:TIGR04282 family arsenosugar biosynthesis glycosyltransferase [Bacteroidales bacterium]MDT8374232.1 TIGR04282 family arsenosugar biosynthesis glycosyltransferase [Bacteroidales bacterium]